MPVSLRRAKSSPSAMKSNIRLRPEEYSSEPSICWRALQGSSSELPFSSRRAVLGAGAIGLRSDFFAVPVISGSLQNTEIWSVRQHSPDRDMAEMDPVGQLTPMGTHISICGCCRTTALSPNFDDNFRWLAR